MAWRENLGLAFLPLTASLGFVALRLPRAFGLPLARAALALAVGAICQ